MKRRVSRFVALLAALSAGAPAYAADDASNRDDAFNRVVSAITLYFDDRGDGDPDKAVLVNADGCGNFDLYLYVADQVHGFKWTDGPALVKKQAIAAGSHCAQAVLKAGARGALQVIARNDWILPTGRETLTIVYRDKQFLVAGYASQVSSITGPETPEKPERFSTCDLNFLTGKGRRGGRPMKITRPAPKLADWTEDTAAALCGD